MDQLLFEQNPIPMLIYAWESLEILKVNAAFLKKYHYAGHEIEEGGLTIKDIHPEDAIPGLLSSLDGLDLRSLHDSGVHRHISKEGRTMYMRITSQYVPFEGRDARLVASYDITEQVEAEQRSTASFNELQHHLSNTPLASIKMDPEFKIKQWSGQAARMSGYKADEVLGKSLMSLGIFDAGQSQRMKRRIEALVQGSHERNQFESKIIRKDGEIGYIRVYASVLRHAGGALKSVLTLIEDITDSEEIQAELRRSEELFRNLFVNSPAALVMVDSKNHIQRVNESFETLFGYSLEEIRSRDIDQLLVPPDQQASAVSIEKHGFIGDDFRLEGVRLTKAGQPRDVIIAGMPVRIDEEVVAGIGMYIDVTWRKKSEKRLKKSLEEKQVLLEEVHHRVKNNLAIISGLLQMQTLHVDDERLTRYIQNSQLRIRSMAIVHEMLYKSRTLTALNMRSYIHELANVISSTLGPDEKEIETTVESEKVELNINQAIPCALAISELITNAYEYAFEGRKQGVVSVKLWQSKNDVTISVKDDGIGLPDNFEEMRQKSLGLSLIENLCNQLETEIEIGSDASGTQFKFTFEKAEVSGSSSLNRVS